MLPFLRRLFPWLEKELAIFGIDIQVETTSIVDKIRTKEKQSQKG